MPTSLLDLLHTGNLRESISSWTTNPDVAKAHLEGVQPDATCVIFKHTPSPSEVWINLAELIKSERFQNALQGGSFPAIRTWMAREHEIILEVESLAPEDVYAWGGFAGTVDQLKAAAQEAGLTTEEIMSKESELQLKAGQEWWLSEEGSRELALRARDVALQRYIHPPPEQAA